MIERKVAVVTAAARGGIDTRRKAADGFDAVVNDVHERHCTELAAEMSSEHDWPFLTIPLDVRDVAAIEQCMAHTELDVRLAASVLPGDTLVVAFAERHSVVSVDARVGETTVLSGGRARF